MKFFLFLITSVFLTTYCLAQTKNFERDKIKMKNFNAESTISGDAQLASHYIVRGLSYSDNNPAMNASFLANLNAQIQLGLWGSNISNLNAADDNFWLKFFSKINFDFSDGLFFSLFISDDHFYKSTQRNGQIFGADFNFKSYEFGLELQNNYEGTRAAAEYIWGGKLFDYKYNLKYGGYAGINLIHNSPYNSYIDLKVVGQYVINPISTAEIGLTFNSDSSQFGIRDDPAAYLAVKLYY